MEQVYDSNSLIQMFKTSLCQGIKHNSFKCRAFYLRGIAYLSIVLFSSNVNNNCPIINEAFSLYYQAAFFLCNLNMEMEVIRRELLE